MPDKQNRWTREKLILTLSVYFQLPPFGRFNHSTKEVKELANLIGRSAVLPDKLIMSIEHHTNRDYLAYHRDRIYLGA